jgi:hypothetical protein
MGPWVRLRVWLKQQRLTEELAARGDANDSAELTAIAHELIGTRGRRRLADGVDRLVHDAAGPPRPLTPAAPLNRGQILAAREELAALADRLRDPEPVTVHGMALADLLLHDGASPVFNRESPGSVSGLARIVRERLDDPIG